MRKSILLGVLLLGLFLVGCGGKFEPTLAKYNEAYVSKTNQDNTGMNATINITKVYKENGTVKIEIGAPTDEQIKYMVDNFMFYRPLDEEGKELNIGKILLDGNTITITGVEDTVKYLEIGPFKNDDAYLIYQVE